VTGNADEDGNGDATATDTDRPDWWRENDRLRAALDLPAYEPPRFADGSYVHETVAALEREGHEIRLLAVEPRYPDDWEIRVDGRRAGTVGRRRDGRANTVYETTAPAFRELVRAAARGADDDADADADADDRS
jgi:hypothetical protein